MPWSVVFKFLDMADSAVFDRVQFNLTWQKIMLLGLKVPETRPESAWVQENFTSIL